MKWFQVIVLILGVAFCRADENLPRVLILGDPVYQEPAGQISKELKGKVKVVYPRPEPGEVFNSETILVNLDKLLGEDKWDVIHFNVGLGDLVYRAPGMKSFRVFPRHAGGVRTTSPEQYEKNLNELAVRLKKTGAKLTWASTTPIRHSTTDVFELKSEITYNAIAAKVMKRQGIPVNDMYSYVLALIDMDKPASHGAALFHFDRKPIHSPIVEVIQKELR